jgi:hypothetical protein
MNRNLTLLGSLCIPMLFSTGCAVGMALSGERQPNLAAFSTGSTRGEVELQLGQSVQTTVREDGGRTDVYQYELGDEPSAGRAIGHGVMDVATLGLWEVVGTPIEAVQGDVRRVVIEYDTHDRVQKIR